MPTTLYIERLAHVSPGIFENIIGSNADFAPQLVAKTSILKWLLDRIQSKGHNENRGYAAEILSILLQNNRANRLEFGKQDGVETSLKVLSVCHDSGTHARLAFDCVPSNTAKGTQWTQTRPSSWRTSSTPYVLLWRSLRSRSSSSIVKVSISWCS